MPLRAGTDAERLRIYHAAIACVADQYAGPIDVDTVARAAYASRRQIQRVFADIGGTTFRRHLAAVRLAAAATLLADTDLTVQAITTAVGYRQCSQLAQTFRTTYGLTPLAYRRAARSRTLDGDDAPQLDPSI